jgi:Meiotically up-regulated gene 113
MKTTKSHIPAEIVRTAKENGGIALGRARFFTETGIKDGDWLGKFWARWSDAVQEAGFEPNLYQGAFSDEAILEKLASYTLELGHFPTTSELKLKKRSDPSFPTARVFERFGLKRALSGKLAKFCDGRPEYALVAEVCGSAPQGDDRDSRRDSSTGRADQELGYVYLLKSGRFFKIGRSNAVGRRERELAIQLPERSALVHSIKTDDPVGIEAYWHGRFADRRGNGEWFRLSADDVAAFKRRKFM